MSVMTLREVLFRAFRFFQKTSEKIRISCGWHPKGGNLHLIRTRPLFSHEVLPELAVRWGKYNNVDASWLDKIRADQLEIFGKTYQLHPHIDWQIDPVTGIRPPNIFGKSINYRNAKIVGNIKVLWEMGRHQHLIPIAELFAMRGDQHLKEKIALSIDSFVEQNPFSKGIHWCTSLEVALRGIAWALIHSFVSMRVEGGLFAISKNPIELQESIFNHSYFIRHFLSRHSSANNHLVGELSGLYCISSVFCFGEVSSNWAQFARNELILELNRQVHPDGVDKEQAVRYHVEVMDYYAFLYAMSHAVQDPFPREVLDKLKGMALFLEVITPANGKPPEIGDSDLGTVTRFVGEKESENRAVLNSVYSFLANQKNGLSGKAFWYTTMLTGHRGDEAVVATSFLVNAQSQPLLSVFPDGGYAVIRDKKYCLVFDAGPLGYPEIAAHGHADALSFCLAYEDLWWIVDPGTYSYHDEAELRDYFRGTAAHNTISVDRQDQSISGGPFLWTSHAQANLELAKETGEQVVLQGSHNGYQRLGVNHCRRIEWTTGRGKLIIRDELAVSGRRQNLLHFHLHFHPDVKLELIKDSLIASHSRQPGELRIDLDTSMDWSIFSGCKDPILGWYSEALGTKCKTPTLRGTLRISPGVKNVSFQQAIDLPH